MSLTHGLLGTVTDLTLYSFFLTLSSFGKQPTYIGYDQAFNEASKLLSDFNYQTIYKTLTNLRQKRLVAYSPIDKTLSMTPKGKQYLKRLLPEYRQNRHWDGRMYLITYDIPERFHRQRTLLRNFIRGLGAGMLQESVFLVFKNPKSLISSFIEERHLTGMVIVSDLGQDGAVGDEDLSSLIKRIYKLDAINRRYGEFLNSVNNKKRWTPLDVSYYFSILKYDPQLPFELLPQDWLGDKAKSLCEKHWGKLLT